MARRGRGPVAAAILSSALLLARGGGASAQDLSISPAVSEPDAPGFTVAILIDAADLAVQGVSLTIGFDPDLVSLEGVDPGSWLTDAEPPYFFHDFTEPGCDAIRLDAALLGAEAGGGGELAVCRFTARAVGVSPLSFLALEVRDGDNQSQPFSHSLGDEIRIRGGEVYIDPSFSHPSSIEFTVDLAIRSPGQWVKGLETRILYDPDVVLLDRIEPGSWLDDSGLQYFFFDHTALEPPGVIHCDLAFLDGVHAGSGQLAVLHFSARATGVTLLPFFELDVRDAENQPLVFSHSVGDSILIDPLIGAEGWSFGRVKQAFR